MNVEQFRSYCLSKKAATESLPFNEYVLVFKVMGKMFSLIDLSDPTSINLKCDPEYSLELREKHPDIYPGFHMSKKHWNTVNINGALDDRFICTLIDHSYDIVVGGLTKKCRRN